MQITLNHENSMFDSSFQKDLKKMDSIPRRFVVEKLSSMLQGDEPQDIKALKNYPFAQYRLKVGDFRILFTYDPLKKKYRVHGCKPRKSLY